MSCTKTLPAVGTNPPTGSNLLVYLGLALAVGAYIISKDKGAKK